MILCDAGPLVALIDRDQGEAHDRCRQALDTVRDVLVTTWPCVTEAMYLAHRIGGWPMQRVLWRLIATDVFDIHLTTRATSARMEAMMERYENVPMDMADASLFAVAEQLGVRKILTLDNDFRVYRFDDGGFFEVIP